MFYSYKGIGVDIEEDGGAFYAKIGEDIKLWGNTIEEVQEILKVEVDYLREKYYEDLIPLEYEHAALNISREQFYHSIKHLGSRLQDMGNVFQNPLFCLEELDIDNWKEEYKHLIDDIANSYDLGNQCIKSQGW